MPKVSISQEKKTKTNISEEKDTRKSVSKTKIESPYSKLVENAIKVAGKTENNEEEVYQRRKKVKNRIKDLNQKKLK